MNPVAVPVGQSNRTLIRRGVPSQSRFLHFGSVFGPGNRWPTLALGLLLGAGCHREKMVEPAPVIHTVSNTPPASLRPETYAQREARLDATVWKDELLALGHEATFVKLRDDIRGATNRLAVLAGFPFSELILPTPEGEPHELDLGIREQRFSDTAPRRLAASSWSETLTRLGAGGWRLDQAEWNHELFTPPSPGQPATSEFSFHLHGERPPSTRFIITGSLGVEWGVGTNGSPGLPVRGLKVSHLTVLERSGSPGFSRIANVTPSAPARRGDLVNLHPLIVTDLEDDGDDDIILGGINQVMINQGDATFTPHDLIAEPFFHGARVAGLSADFNGDGKPDFLTAASQGLWTNQLVLHAGRGTLPFTGEPERACPELRVNLPGLMTAGDIDHDGDLDVWFAQYQQPYAEGRMPTPFYDANDGYPSALLLNDGTGHFRVATQPAGLAAKVGRRTISGSFADLDDDGDLDLITVNDFSGVDLYHNDGAGRFTDETSRLEGRHLYGMAHAFGDFNHDGQLDFLVTGMSLPTVRRLDAMKLGPDEFPDRTRMRTDMTYGNRTYLSRDGRWIAAPFADQLARAGWAWGTVASDFDNDGDLDFYFANGNISGESVSDYDSRYWRHDIYLGTSQPDPALFVHFARQFEGVTSGRTSYNGHQHNVFFLDVGANHYRDVAYLMDLADETDSRAVVSADLDNDGRLDLLVSEIEYFDGTLSGRFRLRIHRNVLPSRNHWIGVRLPWDKGGRSPVGAKVFVHAGDRKYVAQVVTGTSYQAQHPNTVHFGLGSQNTVQELRVIWPSGETEVIQRPAIDRYHRLPQPP